MGTLYALVNSYLRSISNVSLKDICISMSMYTCANRRVEILCFCILRLFGWFIYMYKGIMIGAIDFWTLLYYEILLKLILTQIMIYQFKVLFDPSY